MSTYNNSKKPTVNVTSTGEYILCRICSSTAAKVHIILLSVTPWDIYSYSIASMKVC